MATKYTIDNAHLALPYLVHCAKMRKTITYGELAKKIGRHPRAARHFLGYIRDEICARRRLPLLTAIVVNQNTDLPGEGWLPGGTQHLSPDEYIQKYGEFRDQVFACNAWDALLQELGLQPVQRTDDDLDNEGKAYATYAERHAGVGEGEPHQRLKEYVARNPNRIGLRPIKPAQREYLFASGDRCDLAFQLDNKRWAVIEIKNGEDGELVKGTYQAIKYRALMAAEKGHGAEYPVDAYLVAYEIADDILTFASKFGIQCHVIPHSEVAG